MHLDGFFQSIKEYAVQEMIVAAIAFFGRDIFKKKTASKDAERASSEGAMFLTPDGWETDTRRFHSDAPITPR